MRAVRLAWATVLLLPLGGCSRPGPAFTAVLPVGLEALYQAARTKQTAPDWSAVARAQIGRRDWPAAVEAYEQALAADPQQLNALGELAGLKLAHGERAEAEALISRLEKSHGESATAQSILGDLYALLGKPQLSVASFRKALRLDPTEPVALLRVGQVALKKGDLAEARQLRDRLVAVAPTWNEAKAYHMAVAEAAGESATVERLLTEAHQAHPVPQSRAMLSTFYFRQRRFADALRINDEWLATHAKDIPATIARAEALVKMGRDRDGRRALEKLVDSQNPDPRAYLALGKLRFEAKRIDEAVSLLRDAVTKAPTDSGLQLEAAGLLAQHGKPQEALDIYRRIATDDPRFRAEIARRVGLMAQQAGVKPADEGGDMVESNYLLALESNANDYAVLNNLAFHYAEQKKNLKTAKQLIDRAIQLHGEDPTLLDTRGWVAFQAGDPADAGKDFRAAVAGSPNDAIAHYHLALVKEQDGDRPGALTLAQQALALDEKFVGRTACQELVQRLKGTK